MAKLQTLKPRVQTLGKQIQSLATRPGMIERKRGSAGVKDRANIRKRDCWLCQECKRNGTARVGTQVDHIVPLWNGGTDDACNKELLCDECHDAKTKREAAERSSN